MSFPSVCSSINVRRPSTVRFTPLLLAPCFVERGSKTNNSIHTSYLTSITTPLLEQTGVSPGSQRSSSSPSIFTPDHSRPNAFAEMQPRVVVALVCLVFSSRSPSLYFISHPADIHINSPSPLIHSPFDTNKHTSTSLVGETFWSRFRPFSTVLKITTGVSVEERGDSYFAAGYSFWPMLSATPKTDCRPPAKI